MNVTELARILKITPKELLEKLPQMGFHIGRRAIKIDTRTANKIISDWPMLVRRLAEQKEKEKKIEAEKLGPVEKKEIKIPKYITVRDLSAASGLPVSKILSELMKNGIFASMNERIDFDTASIIGSDLGFEAILEEKENGQREEAEEGKLKRILEKEDALAPRPPVIVVMGHVDHGKTKLLDSIRKTDVVSGEAGGITQHIGAYQIIRKEKTITFIDTPGHEAFTAMRGRGAKVADIAILVVAADDGVKPQTVEAFNIIKAAGLPFVVAINKVDKEGADINRVKQELSTQLNILPEDWGGKTVCAEVSAKEGRGIEDLLDVILLVADMEAEKIKANPASAGVGTIVESRVDKGEGPVATILVQNGTLKIGDQLCFNNIDYGKIRALKNYKGENITAATPSTPAKIIGLKTAPQVGDILEVGQGEKIKIKNIRSAERPLAKKENEDEENGEKINFIIKSDVLGSAEAIEESLEKISSREMRIKIVHKGLGNITEGDVEKAEAAGAEIIGFNVKPSPRAEEIARAKNIKISVYRIIYDLINYAKEKMQAEIKPEIKRTDLGRMKVAAIFRTEKKGQIIGGKVIDGRAEAESLVEIYRNGEIIGVGKIPKIRYGKEEMKIAEKDSECGAQYEGKPIIEAGDILNFYKEEKITKKI